jgi:transposase-like protein
MPKPNWRTQKLSGEEKKEIVRLHCEGLRNVEICRELKLNRNTVHLALVKAGLRITRRPPLPEKKVLELLRKGIGSRTIGKMLKVSHRHVLEFARKRGFCKPKKEVSQATITLAVGAILRREGSASAISKRFGMPYGRTLAMAHALLQCERFLPTWKHPLSSYFPSRPPQPMRKEAEPCRQDNAEAGFIHLVDFITKHMGEVPKDPDELSKLLLAICLHYIPRPVLSAFTSIERENVQRYFAVHIAQALDTLRQSENCAWKN